MPNTPIQYSAAWQGTGNVAVTLGQGQTFPVNFSGISPVGGNPSTFTVGGWIRQELANAGGTIFSAYGQLYLTMPSGLLTATLGNVQLTSEVPITDTLWHYVAVTYSPTIEPNETGILTLYLDGMEVAGEAVNVTTPGQVSGGCYLSPNGALFSFASWSIWSRALPPDVIGAPQWGAPASGSDSADALVAAFDFAAGAATDMSGNNYPVSVATQYSFTPSMSLNSGVATIQSSTVTPGEGSGKPAAFSILGWANALLPNWSANLPLFTNGNGALALKLITNSTGAVFAAFSWSASSFSGSGEVSVPTGQWAHCALTWDGNNTLTFYVNGVSIFSNNQVNPTGFTTHNPSIGNTSTGRWSMQGLSIWSTCLNQTSVLNYMQGADPTGQPGCVANFELLTDFGDSISGNDLSVTSCSLSEVMVPLPPSAAATATDVQESGALEGPRMLLPADLKAIAKKNGIDVDTPVSADEMSGPVFGEIGKWFDGLTSTLSAKGAARLKNEFLRNARIGLELGRQGIKAGSFTMAVEGEDTVVYYHTEAGPAEVYRFIGVELLSTQQWATIIVLDVLNLVVAMFGIVTTAANLTQAAATLQSQISQITNAIQQAYRVSDSTLLQAKKVTMAVWGVINVSNLTYTVVKQIIAGSWWSMAFTIVNTVLMIVALIATDGAAIFIRVVQMGVQLGKLVYDLQQPHSGAATAG